MQIIGLHFVSAGDIIPGTLVIGPVFTQLFVSISPLLILRRGQVPCFIEEHIADESLPDLCFEISGVHRPGLVKLRLREGEAVHSALEEDIRKQKLLPAEAHRSKLSQFFVLLKHAGYSFAEVMDLIYIRII